MDPMILFTPVFEPEGENSFITVADHKSHTSVPMMTGVTADEGSLIIASKSLTVCIVIIRSTIIILVTAFVVTECALYLIHACSS